MCVRGLLETIFRSVFGRLGRDLIDIQIVGTHTQYLRSNAHLSTRIKPLKCAVTHPGLGIIGVLFMVTQLS